MAFNTNLHTNFCDLRNQIVSKLTTWHLALKNQELTAKILGSNLLSLAEHMDKSFLKAEVLDEPEIPSCYRYRVNKIINVILTAFESLQKNPEIIYTETDVLAGILHMVVIQTGRLSISLETFDEMAGKMNMLAVFVDAQVSNGVFECVDESRVDEQCLLKEIWDWVHDNDPLCECIHCVMRDW